MAGKITSKDIHPSRKGSFVTEFTIEPYDKKKLSEYVGRQLLDHELVAIVELVELIRSLKDSESHSPNQDVKATLTKIMNLEKDAVTAFEHCDQDTEEKIIHALWRIGVKDLSTPTNYGVRAAAWLSLRDLPRGTDGRPTLFYRAEFWRRVVDLWCKVGGLDKEMQVSTGDGGETASTRTLFAAHLLETIETEGERASGELAYETIRKKLGKVAP